MTKEELKEKRIELGYTQREFAEFFGVVTGTYWGWEKGNHKSPSTTNTVLSTIKPKEKA